MNVDTNILGEHFCDIATSYLGASEKSYDEQLINFTPVSSRIFILFFIICILYSNCSYGNFIWNLKVPLLQQKNDKKNYLKGIKISIAFDELPLDEALKIIIDRYIEQKKDFCTSKIYFIIVNENTNIELPKITMSLEKTTLLDAFDSLALASKYEYSFLKHKRDYIVLFKGKPTYILDKNHIFGAVNFANPDLIKKMGINIVNNCTNLKVFFEKLGIQLSENTKIDFFIKHKLGNNIIVFKNINSKKKAQVESLIKLLKRGISITTKTKENKKSFHFPKCDFNVKALGFRFKIERAIPLGKSKKLFDFKMKNIPLEDALKSIFNKHSDYEVFANKLKVIKIDNLFSSNNNNIYITSNLENINLQNALDLFLLPTNYNYLFFEKDNPGLVIFEKGTQKTLNLPIIDIYIAQDNLLKIMNIKKSTSTIDITDWFTKLKLGCSSYSKVIFCNKIIKGENCIIFICQDNNELEMMKTAIWLAEKGFYLTTRESAF